MSGGGAGRWIARVVLALLVLFALAQLVRPARTNPPEDSAQRLDAHLTVPSPVAAILDRACADCHSNRTRWPGYSNVAPVSWLVIHDVNEGREELNFSEWGRYSAVQQAKKLGKSCEEAREGEMPPTIYLVMHRNAKLSPVDVDLLCNWTDSARGTLPVPAPAAH